MILILKITDKAEEETENNVLIIYFLLIDTTRKLAEDIHNIINGYIVELRIVSIFGVRRTLQIAEWRH